MTTKTRDRYQCSALVGTDPKIAHWTPMWEVKWGGSALTEANEAIADHETITKVAIYRNRRFVRYVYAPMKAVCA